MDWLKKYSIQLSIVTALAGIVMATLPYFGQTLSPTTMGVITAICGVATAVGRIIPQLK